LIHEPASFVQLPVDSFAAVMASQQRFEALSQGGIVSTLSIQPRGVVGSGLG